MDKVIDFFTKSCEKYGDCSWKASCMINDECQESCYHIGSQTLNHRLRQGISVLDVGCGQGSYYEFLKDRGFNGAYEGVDITPKMIEIAKAKYPQVNFTLADFNEIDKKYDWVIAVSTFNVKTGDDHLQYTYDSIKKIFSLCKVGCAFTLLSPYGYEIAKSWEDLYCYEPGNILTHCLQQTPLVVLNHAALTAEFAVLMYKG